MKKHVVALDSRALAQLMMTSMFLLGLVFLAGAVVGFAVHPDVASGVSAPVGAPTSSAVTTAVQESVAEEPAAPVRPVRVAVLSEPAVEETEDRVPVEELEYAVQLGVFRVESNVLALTADLRRRGYDPLVVAMRNRSGQWLRRVHLSVFGRRESAAMAARSFREKEGLDAIVVPYTKGTP